MLEDNRDKETTEILITMPSVHCVECEPDCLCDNRRFVGEIDRRPWKNPDLSMFGAVGEAETAMEMVEDWKSRDWKRSQKHREAAPSLECEILWCHVFTCFFLRELISH